MPQMRAVMSGGSVKRRAPQQRLEEARRLVDAQLDELDGAVAHAHVHRALALHARERVHLERAPRAHPAASRNGFALA